MCPPHSDDEVRAAVEALADPERFRRAESVVAAAAPQLQHVLAQALEAGGWFGEAHEAEVRKAVSVPGDDDRERAIRTMLAEEARMGMMVGVAVGWALAEQLSAFGRSPSRPAEEEE